MSRLVPPHGGGPLKPLLIAGPERAAELKRAEGLTAVPMTSRESSDLVMMAMGAYTPLDGFMGHDDWRGVCLDMRLGNGVFWPIPITLSCPVARTWPTVSRPTKTWRCSTRNRARSWA